MARTKKSAAKDSTTQKSNGANLGFERQLWEAADALRGSMDAAEWAGE